MASSATQGITVAVTGDAGGLGKAIAIAFLEAGSNVAICDLNQDQMALMEKEWAKNNARILVSKTDITDEGAVEEFIDSVVAKFGRLDLVVNNAGIIDNFDPIATTSKASCDKVININLTGTFLTTKSAVNAMQKQLSPGGTIINIGSVASYRGVNGGLAYTVSKHGIVGLTRNTAGYYGDMGINCIALLIGGMDDTNLGDNFHAGVNQEAMMRIGAVNPGYVAGKTSVASQIFPQQARGHSREEVDLFYACWADKRENTEKYNLIVRHGSQNLRVLYYSMTLCHPK
ncbi:hypothetical protein NW754_003170 [Fusarium falciforme]|nr:hypothetical protein NW754_003170 [Fusarium falciforme]KAJ4192350.1 hypothetical protein NW767_010574 [Fusarium falciforme]